MDLMLYRLEGCPYCESVVDELEELDLVFESVWVEGLHSRRNEVKSRTGQRRVPALIDDEHGVVMSDSRRIIEYVRTTYGENSKTTDATVDDR